ncbi:DUF3108 domain-containing protein [Bradyrhizobium paxllaeri]|uniref:DUF3108 domain-containing protein n=1 Tax=Bradyrhizobium paxllaeri TaxID=190148 RepID=UPI000810399B|nr:DUF3108 domain-containing protein [Bradyrhizobium paxllaeri]
MEAIMGFSPAAKSLLPERRLPWAKAGAAVRALLTRATIRAAILYASSTGPSAAEDGDIRAAYEVAFAGLTIAQADVLAAVRGGAYKVRVNYRTSGAARLMGSATGEAVSSGAYKRGRLIPATFDLAHQGSQRVQKIGLTMSDGKVNAMSIDPPAKSENINVPVTLEHLKNITDPLSALLLPAVAQDGKSEAGVCDRTVPVFDGRRRFDVSLKSKGTRMANKGPYVGPLTVCELRITPIAGEMRSESSSQAKRPSGALGDVELAFGVVDAQRIYIPVSLSAKIGYMTLEARLTQLSSSGSR